MRTLPLGLRIVLFVVPLALIPLGIVGGVAYTSLEAGLRADLETAQLRALDDAAGQVRQAMEEAARLSRALAASPELSAFLARPGRPSPTLQRLADVSLGLSSHVSHVRILAPGEMDVLLVARAAPAGPSDAEAAAVLPRGLRSPAGPVEVLDAVGDALVAGTAHPASPAGAGNAWIVAHVATHPILREWGARDAGGGAFAVVDHRGRVLAATVAGFPIRLTPAQLSRSGAARVVSVDGLPPGFDVYSVPIGLYAAADTLTARPVFLVHVAQRGDVVERVRALRWTAGWLSAAAVAIGLIGAGLIARTIVHPLSALLDMSRRIGEGQFHVTLTPQRDDEIGQLVRAFNAMAASLADYQDRLVRAETFTALGRVASTVAHEVRNPLNAMRGCVEFLRVKRPGDDVVQHHAAIIAEEITALDDFVRDFLRVARLEHPALEPVRLGALARNRLDSHRPAADAQRVTIVLRPDGDGPAVMADPRQIGMVFDNLINNAIEAMPEGGTLTVECLGESGAPVVRVSDTGIGIPASVRPTLFTPFSTNKPDGTGIGLAISRRIAEAHGAAITYETVEGLGTTFEIRFPIGADPAAGELSAGA